MFLRLQLQNVELTAKAFRFTVASGKSKRMPFGCEIKEI